jgi:antirestriction protein ArdC
MADFDAAFTGRLIRGADTRTSAKGAPYVRFTVRVGFGDSAALVGVIAWIELLKADKRAFFTTCSKASKAADYLRGLALAEPTWIAA